jgi:hypothetical protein
MDSLEWRKQRKIGVKTEMDLKEVVCRAALINLAQDKD